MKTIQILRHSYLLTILLIYSNYNSYSQNLYAIDTIRSAYITFYDANWDHLLDSFKTNDLDDRVLADLIIDGIQFDSVGVKYKGNSSYNSGQLGGKKPFNISIDHIKDQDLYGYTTLKLNNMFKDPSCVREVLSYEMLRNYMPSSQANYMVLNINGNLHGLYTSVESVNKDFLSTHFKSENNSFFKCDPMWGSPPPMGCPPSGGSMSALFYTNSDTACYKNSYEIKSDSENDWIKLVNLIEILNTNSSQIDQVLDVDRAIWMLVFNNLFVNLDSYTGSGHNYYIYENDYDIFNTIVWDLNENFGGFSNAGGQPPSNLSLNDMRNLSPLWNDQDNSRPLIKYLLANPNYKNRFFAHYRTFISEFLSNNAMKDRAVELQNLINSHVASDPNPIYSYQAFQNGLNQMNGNVPGINELMDDRFTFLSSEQNIIKQGPSISNIQQSNQQPTSSDTVWITAQISGGNQATLHYKDNLQAPFQSIQMFDDGNHNDGNIGDGVWGASIPAKNSGTTVYYYIYAEDNDAGFFSPERAEYEYYSYTVQGIQLNLGDLVINEFLASNNNVVSDQDGEYDDWIELYNNTTDSINLNNMYLSDDFTASHKWRLPDTIIEPDGFITIWADNDDQQGLHSSFKLSASGESVVLSNSNGTLLDSISYGLQNEDISYGRYPNGSGNFQPLIPTFNNYNSILTTLEKDKDVFKIFPNPANNLLNIELLSGFKNETIEIYNPLMQQVKKSTQLPNDKILSIALNDLSNGMYFVKINKHIKKFIINRN